MRWLNLLKRVLLSLVLLILLGFIYVLFMRTRRPVVNSILYMCPIIGQLASTETANCVDCMFYPVDKTHRLAATYVPSLVPTNLPGGGSVTLLTRAALEKLFADATRRGFSPVITSAYRSYADQERVFRSWFAQELSQTFNPLQAFLNTLRYSALPGHSEHQLGTAVDINCRTCIPFDREDIRNIALWQFLEQNAHKYGFVISYPPDAENRTGYLYEPWHLRFIGLDYAEQLYEQAYLQGSGACALSLLRAKVP